MANSEDITQELADQPERDEKYDTAPLLKELLADVREMKAQNLVFQGQVIAFQEQVFAFQEQVLKRLDGIEHEQRLTNKQFEKVHNLQAVQGGELGVLREDVDVLMKKAA